MKKDEKSSAFFLSILRFIRPNCRHKDQRLAGASFFLTDLKPKLVITEHSIKNVLKGDISVVPSFKNHTFL
jgi:hypothetical protein